MITCPKCKKELEDGTKFCYVCGSPVEAPTPVEETPVAEETPAVEEAPAVEETPVVEPAPAVEPTPVVNPTPVVEPTPAVQAEPKANPAQGILEKVKALPKKTLAIVAGAVVGVIVLIVLVGALLSGGSDKQAEYVVYLKDDQLYLNLLGGKESIEVSEELTDDWSTSSIISDMDEIYRLIYVTDDEKTIIYPDEISYDGFTLYHRDAKKADAEPVKIDKNVASYTVSENEKTIIYRTSDGKLYSYNFKEEEKIASDVSYYYASTDGKRVVYVDYDATIYVWENGKEEKIAKDASISGILNDTKTIFYTKDGKFYVKDGNKEEVKIDKDVYSVVAMFDDGTVYFLKLDSKTVSLMDYVNDDMAEMDASMVEPEYPDYYDYDWPDYSDYESYEEYEAAYDAMYEEYEAAYDAYWDAYDLYWDKDNRDYIREQLQSAELEVESYTLCYYDGKEVVEVATDFDYYSYDYSDRAATPVLVFHTEKTENLDKLNMSEIDSYWDVEDYVYYADKSTTLNIAIKGTATVVDLEDIEDVNISNDGKKLYVVADADYDNYEGTLYEASVSGSLGKFEVYDEEVTLDYLKVYNNGSVAYTKEDGEAFYINKKLVDEDVARSSISIADDGNIVYYMKDFDDSDYTGTLCISNNGKEGTEIADDAFFYFAVTPDGNLLYLGDYDYYDYEGTLYFSKNGKEGTEIDDEAQMIIDPLPNIYNYYY